MDYSIRIANIINNYVKVNTEDLIELVKAPPKEEMGDYCFPCYVLKKSIQKSPVVIAEEISKNIQDDIFEKVDNYGPYINFFINKEKLAKSIIKDILENKECFGDLLIGNNNKVYIEYATLNENKSFDLNLLYSIILGNYLSQLYKKAGYVIQNNVYIKNNEDKISDISNVLDILNIKTNVILEKNSYKSKLYKKFIDDGLIYTENETSIINLKSYNLPPLICSKDNNEFTRGIQSINDYINKKSIEKNFKVIYVTEKKKSIEIKKIFSVLDILGFEYQKDCVEFKHNSVKFIQNSVLLKIEKSIDADYIFKEAEYRVKKRIINNRNKIDVDFRKFGVNCVIFELLRYPLEQDIHLDFDHIFSEKDNSTYKILENFILVKNSINNPEVIDKNIDYIDIITNRKTISKLKDFPSVIEDSLEGFQPYIIAKYIEDLNLEIISTETYNKELSIMAAIIQVIENSLNLLGIFME